MSKAMKWQNATNLLLKDIVNQSVLLSQERYVSRYSCNSKVTFPRVSCSDEVISTK